MWDHTQSGTSSAIGTYSTDNSMSPLYHAIWTHNWESQNIHIIFTLNNGLISIIALMIFASCLYITIPPILRQISPLWSSSTARWKSTPYIKMSFRGKNNHRACWGACSAWISASLDGLATTAPFPPAPTPSQSTQPTISPSFASNVPATGIAQKKAASAAPCGRERTAASISANTVKGSCRIIFQWKIANATIRQWVAIIVRSFFAPEIASATGNAIWEFVSAMKISMGLIAVLWWCLFPNEWQ